MCFLTDNPILLFDARDSDRWDKKGRKQRRGLNRVVTE